jgi:hypothetical protein
MPRPAITVCALVLAATTAACTLYPAEPSAPTFTSDVRPILMAHCVRCHGANDMLANEIIDGAVAGGPPLTCYLDSLDDRGDCSSVDGGPPDRRLCKRGAGHCAARDPTSDLSLFDFYVFRAAGTADRMPPPPAAPLNEWEMNTLQRWVANGAPR